MRDNLTKKEIINSIYMQLGFSKKVAENILEDLIEIISNSIYNNKKLKISNFGTFFLKRKKRRVGRNPKTKEEKVIKERNVITFKASAELKNYINNINE
tara:strand:+ start:1664 stop:1960 length:297 start_codon:yes stop_codon:yes gene_type:complete